MIVGLWYTECTMTVLIADQALYWLHRPAAESDKSSGNGDKGLEVSGDRTIVTS